MGAAIASMDRDGAVGLKPLSEIDFVDTRLAEVPLSALLIAVLAFNP